MLASIIITDADEASARAHVSPAQSFIALDLRCSTGARAASVCISPAVARKLRDAIDIALEDFGNIRAELAEQRAAVSGREAV